MRDRSAGPRPRPRDFLVKLEYRVTAPNRFRAVDALTASIRLNASTDTEITRSAELLRTDVRRPGEGGEW
jgi:hypothetical protein